MALTTYHYAFQVRRVDTVNVPIRAPFAVGFLRLESLLGHLLDSLLGMAYACTHDVNNLDPARRCHLRFYGRFHC